MTPCEEMGYEVGDKFVAVAGNGFFKGGANLTLEYDDGSSCPRFTDGKERWCLTLNDVKPVGQQWVPEVGEKAVATYTPKHGHSAIGHEVEVKSLFKSGEIDFAAVEYQGSCYCLRADMFSKPTTEEDRAVEELAAVLREKCCIYGLAGVIAERLITEGYRKQPQQAEVDFNDPANWRAGDVVECVKAATRLYTEGQIYKIINNKQGEPIVQDNDQDRSGTYPAVACSKFRFHSRP